MGPTEPRNRPRCRDCNKVSDEEFSVETIKTIPKVAVFQLIRATVGMMNKNFKYIECPGEIEINDKKLKMKAKINHIGASINTGHYTSSIRGSKQWIVTDDEEVSASVTKSCSDITSSNILQVAYAIIYLKMDSLDTQELDVSSDSNEDIGSGTEGKEPFEDVRKMAASLALDVTTPEAKLGQIVKRISFSKEG